MCICRCSGTVGLPGLCLSLIMMQISSASVYLSEVLAGEGGEHCSVCSGLPTQVYVCLSVCWELGGVLQLPDGSFVSVYLAWICLSGCRSLFSELLKVSSARSLFTLMFPCVFNSLLCTLLEQGRLRSIHQFLGKVLRIVGWFGLEGTLKIF